MVSNDSMVLRLLVPNSSLPLAHVLTQTPDPRPEHLFYPPTSQSSPSSASPILFSSFQHAFPASHLSSHPLLLSSFLLSIFLSYLLLCDVYKCDTVSEYLRTLKKLQSTTTNLSLQEARTLEQRLRIIIEQKVSAPLPSCPLPFPSLMSSCRKVPARLCVIVIVILFVRVFD